MRTIPSISDLFKKLDEVILTEFIPAITNGAQCNELERSLMSLPTKLGGLGIPIFSEISNLEYQNSVKITSTLKKCIINQERQISTTIHPEYESPYIIRKKIKNDKQKMYQENMAYYHSRQR